MKMVECVAIVINLSLGDFLCMISINMHMWNRYFRRDKPLLIVFSIMKGFYTELSPVQYQLRLKV